MNEPRPRRRREPLGRPPLAVILPLGLVVAIIVIWSLVWYQGSRHADALIDEWLSMQAVNGRTLTCAERTMGGYPFRIEVDCIQPSVELVDGRPGVVLSAGRLLAVAMVWRLDHVIVELEGPLAVQSPVQDEPGLSMRADWSLWQASLRAPGGRISRVDVVIDDLDLAEGPETPGNFAMTARRLSLHQRPGEGGGDAQVAIQADALRLTPEEGSGDDTPVDLVLSGRLYALPQPMPRDATDFLAAWRANDGAVEIEELRAVQGDTRARATGRLVADAEGRPEGRLRLSLAAPDLRASTALGGLAPLVGGALAMIGRPDEIDGQEAVSGEIEMRNGRVYLGPLPIARLPRLF